MTRSTLILLALPLLTAACAGSSDGSAPQIAQSSGARADADAQIPSFTCDQAQAKAAGHADCATQLSEWLGATSQDRHQQVASCTLVSLIEVDGEYFVRSDSISTPSRAEARHDIIMDINSKFPGAKTIKCRFMQFSG